MSAKPDGPLLGGTRIKELLVDLGRRCAAAGVAADMFVVGGAAIALAYSEVRATRDIDAVFEPKMRVYEVAKSMADEFELPRDWLNDGVKGLLPDFEDRDQQFTLDSEGIHVVVPSPGYLFAMKAVSARIGVDDDDLRLLGKRIGITTVDAAFEAVERYYRRERVSAKTGFFIQTLLQDPLFGSEEASQ